MVLTISSDHRFKHQMLQWLRPSLLFALPWTATSKTDDWWSFDSRWHQPKGSEGFVWLNCSRQRQQVHVQIYDDGCKRVISPCVFEGEGSTSATVTVRAKRDYAWYLNLSLSSFSKKSTLRVWGWNFVLFLWRSSSKVLDLVLKTWQVIDRSHKITGSTSGTVTVTSFIKTSGNNCDYVPPKFLGEAGQDYQLLCSPLNSNFFSLLIFLLRSLRSKKRRLSKVLRMFLIIFV